MRRGTTLTEALLAVALAALALGAMLSLFYSVNRMSHMSELSAALQDGALAMAIIQRDLTQAVQKPDPSISSAVLVKKDSFQLLRGSMRPDGNVDAKLVVYRKERTAAQNFRMRRKFGKEESLLPGLYRNVDFVQLNGAGGPFVRVTLHIAPHDVKAGPGKPQGSDEAVLTTLVRVMGPEMVGSKMFTWKFLDLLKLIPFLGL